MHEWFSRERLHVRHIVSVQRRRLSRITQTEIQNVQVGFIDYRDRFEETLIHKRDEWEQFRNDYQDGGGIKTGLKNAVQWGLPAGIVGGMSGGTILGGLVDMFIYSANTMANSGSLAVDTIPVGPLENPYSLVPLAFAALSAIIAGGYAFYRGILSPADIGRRQKKYRWEDWH